MKVPLFELKEVKEREGERSNRDNQKMRRENKKTHRTIQERDYGKFKFTNIHTIHTHHILYK